MDDYYLTADDFNDYQKKITRFLGSKSYRLVKKLGHNYIYQSLKSKKSRTTTTTTAAAVPITSSTTKTTIVTTKQLSEAATSVITNSSILS